MPQISVIIPAYRPRNVATLKASIRANTDIVAEWIVVDDGSGPDHDAVYDSLAGTQAQLIRLPVNRGQGAARNIGLARAKGEWIKFLDVDDRLDEGHLATLLKQARTLPKNAIAFAPTKHVFTNGAAWINESWRGLPADSASQLQRQLVRPFLSHCGALFPRALLEEHGGYDDTLVTDEDGDLLLRLLIDGYCFVPVEGVHYLYVHHEANKRVSSDNSLRKLEARRRTCEKVEEAFTGTKGPMPSSIREALAQRLDKIAMAYWVAYPAEASELLSKAQNLCPNYRPDIRWPLRFLRNIGGPSVLISLTGLYRHWKRKPKAGA